MFNGKVHTRFVSSSGKKKENTNDNKSFLKEQRIQRVERSLLRKKEISSILIQSIFRKYLVKLKIFTIYRKEFDKKISDILKIKSIFESRNNIFSVPLDEFRNIIRIFFFFCSNNFDKISIDDHKRFNEIQKLFIESVSNQNPTFNIILKSINSIQIINNNNNNNKDIIPLDIDKRGIVLILQKKNYIFNSFQIIIKKILALSIYKIINHLSNNSIISTIDSIELSINCLNSVSTSSYTILLHDNQSNNYKFLDSLMNCLSRLISTECCHGLYFLLTNNNNNSLIFSKVFTVLLSIIERSIQEDVNEFEYSNILGSSKFNIDRSWNNISSIILTIPDMQNIYLLKSLLSSLKKNNCYGWIRCLSEFYDDNKNNNEVNNIVNEKIISSSTILLNQNNSFMNKSSFLGNFCQCVLKSEGLSGLSKSGLQLIINNDSNNSIIWMNSVLNLLNSIPLLSLLRHIEERSDDSLESEEIEESSFLLASGIKRLEYRLLARQRVSRKNELQEWNKLHNQINGLESIIRLYSDSSIIPTLIDLILPYFHFNVTSSSSSLIFNKTIKYKSVFNFINIYARIFISFPSYLDTTINKSKSRISISLSILNSFAFSRNFTLRIWNYLNSFGFSLLIELINTYGDDKIQNSNNNNNSIKLLQECSNLINIDISILRNNLMNILYIFCISYSHQLSATDDEEFFSHEKTLGNEDNSKLVLILKTLLHKMYFIYPIFDGNSTFSDLTSISEDNQLPLLIATTTLFNSLYSRNERRPFLDETSWLWIGINSKDVEIKSTSTFTFKNHLVKTILTCIPQVLSFKERLLIFHTLIESTREDRNINIFSMHNHGVSLTVRRDRLIEDSYNGLQSIDSSRLKGRIQIQFTNEQGLEEAGIDGGGLFKAFIDEFSKSVYDPSVGFFLPTSHQLLTPNPSSSLLGESHLSYFNYIGKMLGKAIFDQILVEPQFSGIFLNVLLGRVNQVDDLLNLDEQLFRSLMNLKKFSSEEIAAMFLTFEIETYNYGEAVTRELLPGGSNINVTKDNIHSYINRYANYKLNVEISEQCRAFLSGFRLLIPVEWIRMFNTRELQLLISGDKRAIDIEDMRRNVHYASGYHDSQPYIQGFWNIVSEMTPDEQSDLIKFVTSCSRLPLLGAKQLNPTFCIQQCAIRHQSDDINSAPRLPSAATCMNLLKLPKYDTLEQLKEKLMYAIKSNSGFELS